MAKPCRIELLGGPRVVCGGQAHDRFRTKKTAGLLALLAVRVGRPVPRAEAIELLWPDSEPDQARNSLSQSVSSLRHQLEPPGVSPGSVLSADRANLSLDEANVETDFGLFRAAAKSARGAKLQGDETAWRRLAEEAAKEVAGEFMPGHDDPWMLGFRDEAREAATELLEALAADALARGDARAALDHGLRAVQVDPWREPARQAVIQAYDALGRPEEALRQYRQLKQVLSRDLGLAPSERTRGLVEHALEKPRSVADMPDLADARPRLPAQVNPFFGRGPEVAAALAAFAEGGRLLTLTGPGGIGKTRLALEAGRAIEDSCPDGAWFVPLADALDSPSMEAALAAALGLPGGDKPKERALAFLRDRHALLVLDNLEQVVDEGAPALVSALLECCPRLRIVATSRRRLAVQGERESVVAPLPSSPDADDPRLALFLDRARAVRPGFSLEGEAEAQARALCEALDGVPLAIELAAARTQVLSVAQMLERIGQRLDLLTSKDRPARHRSLRAALEWSFEALSPELRRAFGRLSVFAGGWAIEAAEDLLEDPVAIDLVAELREFSLVTAEDDGLGRLRFRMLETVREFAGQAAEPDDLAVARGRHAAWFLGLCQAAVPVLEGPRQVEELARLELERANVRAAVEHFVAVGATDDALALVGAAWRFWHLRSHLAEGRALASLALALPGGSPVARSRALNGAGRLAYLQGDYSAAEALHSEARPLAKGDPDAEAFTANALGAVAYETGRYADAVALFEEAMALRRAMGDRFGLGNALSWLGIVLTDQGRHAEARAALEESLAVRREIGDVGGIARSLNSLGIIARQTGDLERAEALYREALATHESLGDRRAVAGVLSNLGMVLRGRGSVAEAAECFVRALTANREIGDRWGEATVLANQASLALDSGDAAESLALGARSLALRIEIGNPWGVALSLEGCAEALSALGRCLDAARLWGRASAIRDGLGSPPAPFDAARIEQGQAAAIAAVGAEAFAEALQDGRGLQDVDALQLVRV
jgi:predicted ATPase/DNA-binding SARP family transcriptional activator